MRDITGPGDPGERCKRARRTDGRGLPLLFFAGLFIMVGALVKTGVIGDLAEQIGKVTEGRALLATMLILTVSAVLSGIIDNIPYVATMSPVVLELTKGVPDPAQAEALWWALAIGADFGGNATAVGASASS